MIYCQTINKECIVVHPLNDVNDTQYIELVKYGDAPILAVWFDNGGREWLWEFDISNSSDYERIKLSIFGVVFDCNTMLELAQTLDEIFNDGFKNILIKDKCDSCDGCTYLQ